MTKKNDAEALIAENTALRAALRKLLKGRTRASDEEPKRKPSAKPDPIWERTPKRCPKCGEEKMVVPGFGVRMNVRGLQRSQPWCNRCRATTNYHGLPRKNRTMNNP